MSDYVHLAVAVKVHVHADDHVKVNENVGSVVTNLRELYLARA